MIKRLLSYSKKGNSLMVGFRAWVKELFVRDDSHEFKPILVEIEDSPLNPLGRVIFWLIILLLLSCTVWMFFGKVDVVITARGKVIPDGEVKVLQALTPGVVKKILVRECEYVTTGQVLMEIDPASIEPEIDSIKMRVSELNLELERLDALLHKSSFVPATQGSSQESVNVQQDVYQAIHEAQAKKIQAKGSELDRIDEQIAALKLEQEYVNSLREASKAKEQRLQAVIDIISRNDYEKAKNELLSYQNTLAENIHKLQELQQTKNQILQEIVNIKENFRAELLYEYTEKQKQLSDLNAQIQVKTFLNSKNTMVSPVEGYVHKIFSATVGGVVSPAQPLITIVPSQVPLVIKAVLLNKDRGLIRKGMPVSLKMDAYNFQKYGLLNGMISNISRDSNESETLGSVYDIYIVPFNKILIVEGTREQIMAGMTLTAEINIGKRRIIEFFIYPLIKYLDEGISVQ